MESETRRLLMAAICMTIVVIVIFTFAPTNTAVADKADKQALKHVVAETM